MVETIMLLRKFFQGLSWHKGQHTDYFSNPILFLIYFIQKYLVHVIQWFLWARTKGVWSDAKCDQTYWTNKGLSWQRPKLVAKLNFVKIENKPQIPISSLLIFLLLEFECSQTSSHFHVITSISVSPEELHQ